MRPVEIAGLRCGGGSPLLWIAGPCVIESHDLTLAIAERLARLAAERGMPLVFKASFDKANRTSGKSFRGPGLEEGLRSWRPSSDATGLPVTTDVHESAQVGPAAEVVRPAPESRRSWPGRRTCCWPRAKPGERSTSRRASSWPRGT